MMKRKIPTSNDNTTHHQSKSQLWNPAEPSYFIYFHLAVIVEMEATAHPRFVDFSVEHVVYMTYCGV